mgnify:FL=1
MKTKMTLKQIAAELEYCAAILRSAPGSNLEKIKHDLQSNLTNSVIDYNYDSPLWKHIEATKDQTENQVQRDVKKALSVLNCTQKHFAKLMNVSPGQVSKWVKHGESMSLRKLQRLNDLIALESAYAGESV